MSIFMNRSVAWMGLALLALAGAAHAQQGQSDWDKIVLEDKDGNVMTSTGGDFVTANVGQLLNVGEHMLLSGDKTLAKVVYYELDDDGNVLRKCVRDYTDPSTYIIDASCVPAAGWVSGGNGVAAGAIAGAAVIGGALLGSGGDTPPGPLSTGPRN
jgi:hypothetical protein